MKKSFSRGRQIFCRLLVLCLFPTVLSADHLSNSKLERGKDELVLAGIEIYRTPMSAIIRRLGNPTIQKEDSPASKDVIGQRRYIWKKPNITIRVETDFSNEPILKGSARELPADVIVDGTDGTLGKTGRGLKLGDPYTSIERTYGSRYARQGHRITVQWETTTALEIGWNSKGLIDHIALLGPE